MNNINLGLNGEEEYLALEALKARCPDCEEEVLGDEDGLCGYCAGEYYETNKTD